MPRSETILASCIKTVYRGIAGCGERACPIRISIAASWSLVRGPSRTGRLRTGASWTLPARFVLNRKDIQAATGELLVSLRVVVTIVLPAAGGLLVASSVRVMAADQGFEPASVVAVDLNLPASRYGADSRTQFYDGPLAPLSGRTRCRLGRSHANPAAGGRIVRGTPRARARGGCGSGRACSARRQLPFPKPGLFRYARDCPGPRPFVHRPGSGSAGQHRHRANSHTALARSAKASSEATVRTIHRRRSSGCTATQGSSGWT